MPFTLASVRSARSPWRSDPLEPIGQSHDRRGLDPQMLDQFADAVLTATVIGLRRRPGHGPIRGHADT